jgi:hypothetical protein
MGVLQCSTLLNPGPRNELRQKEPLKISFSGYVTEHKEISVKKKKREKYNLIPHNVQKKWTSVS